MRYQIWFLLNTLVLSNFYYIPQRLAHASFYVFNTFKRVACVYFFNYYAIYTAK